MGIKEYKKLKTDKYTDKAKKIYCPGSAGKMEKEQKQWHFGCPFCSFLCLK